MGTKIPLSYYTVVDVCDTRCWKSVCSVLGNEVCLHLVKKINWNCTCLRTRVVCGDKHQTCHLPCLGHHSASSWTYFGLTSDIFQPHTGHIWASPPTYFSLASNMCRFCLGHISASPRTCVFFSYSLLSRPVSVCTDDVLYLFQALDILQVDNN